MRKTENLEALRGLVAALVLVAPFFAGCANSPHTELDWPGYNTHLVRNQHASHHPRYADRRPDPRPTDTRKPSPRPQTRPVYSDDGQASSGAVRFAWPVSGHVISTFGSTGDGERNDGINIASQLGAPIRASADGTVTYAGDQLRNYGNLVLIEHGNGFITAYAHAQSISVSRGDHVRKGDVIGTVGESGDVPRPQVHFEIRHGARPIDPTLMLASS